MMAKYGEALAKAAEDGKGLAKVMIDIAKAKVIERPNPLPPPITNAPLSSNLPIVHQPTFP